MSTRAVWATAVICVVVGIAALTLVDGREGGGGLWRVLHTLAFALMTVPVPVALNITLQARRRRLRQDSTDSIEHHADQEARAAVFQDAVLLGALLMLALTVAPGPTPMLWALAYLLLLMADFWVRYALRLRGLRG